MATDRVSDSIVVATSAEHVLDVLSDVESYPEWLDEFKDAEVLATHDDGRLARARFRIAALGISLGFELAYEWSTTAHRGRMAWTLVEGDMLQQLDGAYITEARGEGATRLTYELEVRSTVPLPHFVRRRIAKKIISDSLAGAKTRAEQEVGR